MEQLIKTITEYSNFNDFSIFFKEKDSYKSWIWTLKSWIIFKIYDFKSKIYKSEWDDKLIISNDLILTDNKTETNICINNFYLISFDQYKNTIYQYNDTEYNKFSKIEIYKSDLN